MNRFSPTRFILVALGIAAVGSSVILAVTPLSGLPDTVCGSLVVPQNGGFTGICKSELTHRGLLAAVLLAIGIVLVVLAWRQRATRPRAREAAPVVLMSIGVVVCCLGAWSLARGDGAGFDNGVCGSWLSRVDPHGSYDEGHPALCQPLFTDRRSSAELDFGVAAMLVIAASVLDVRRSGDGPDAVSP